MEDCAALGSPAGWRAEAAVDTARVALSEGPVAAPGHGNGASRPMRVDRLPAACIINGRYHEQRVTGVQRYAREIVRAMDPLLVTRRKRAELLLPRSAEPPTPAAAVAQRSFGLLSGHAWEQLVLPFRRGAPLLNLCNTGPLVRRRQVVCLHDANVFLQPASYRPAFRMLYGALQPLLVRRAAIVTTVSDFSAAMLAQHLGIERRSIVVLPNGHEHALRWQSEAGVLRSLPETRPFVLLLGSRARHKNVDLLLRLAPALDAEGLDLVVTGGRDAIFAAEAPAAKAAGNVHWLGAVSDGELAALMERALCLAFPSWTEGFGLPIIEAMTRHCPVVASDCASMPEVCGTAALLAPPDSPAAWLDAITTLHRASGLRADLVGRGAEQARRFSWSSSAAGYLDLLERLA